VILVLNSEGAEGPPTPGKYTHQMHAGVKSLETEEKQFGAEALCPAGSYDRA
jgi:hypothetical protein